MLNKLVRGEKGQALLTVLIMMLFGSLIIPPVLSHIGTGLWTGKVVYEEEMKLLYAADAGVEDALWQIKNAKLGSLFTGYNKYNYTLEYGPHTLAGTINGGDVSYKIRNVWIPKDLTAPDHDTAENIIEYGNTTGQGNSKLIITGSPMPPPQGQTSATEYQIGIIYYYGSEGTDALKVEEIGIWLPPGFSYADNCSLASDPDTQSWATPVVSDYCSGKAVVWTFGSPMFKLFPGIPTTPPLPNPMVSTITFAFTGPAGQTPSFISWITTSGSGVSSIPYAWDGDKRIYEIKSTATYADKYTEIDAHAMKIEPRQMGSAVGGDYVAIGNTLMMPDPSYSSLRNRLLKESSATITSGSGESQIPANATVEAAYLYWSGFIDHYYWYWHTNQGRSDPYASGWYFSSDADNLTGLVYDADNLPGIIANAKVGTVSFGTTGAMQNVTANLWQVYPKTNDSPNCWYYCCRYDATDLVKQFIDDGLLGSNGSGTYTLSHTSGVIDQTPPRDITVDFPRTPGAPSSDHTRGYSFYLYNSSGSSTVGYTGYPLGTPATKLPGASSYEPNKQIPNTGNTQNRYNASYAGWSLVIIYSSPDTEGHLLYPYDISNPNFRFTEGFGSSSNPDFDGDGSPGGRISGFLIPQQIPGETNAAKLTCFVGEGDEGNVNDYIKITGPSGTWKKLWDGVTVSGSNTKSNPNNIWNSKSLVLGTVSGVDIDTPGIDPTLSSPEYITWSSNVLRTGDTYAQIDLPSPNDGFTLIYIILSFRSEITTGGTLSYLVR